MAINDQGYDDGMGGMEYDPNNTGGGFDWSQYTGGVTGQTTGTVLPPQGDRQAPPGYHYGFDWTSNQLFPDDPNNPNTPPRVGYNEGWMGGTNTGATPGAQSGAFDPSMVDAFGQAWMASGGRTVQDLQRFVAANPQYGATLTGSKGDKVVFPNQRAFDAVIAAGEGGGRGASWGDITGTSGQGGGQQGGGSSQPYNFATDDPSYKWRLEQGLQGVQKSASARGTLLTGGTLKDLNDYAQGAASQEYGAAFNRKATLADMGLRAAGGQVGAASSYGTAAANQYGNIGNANSAGSIRQGNIWGPYTNGLGQWGQ